MMGVRWHRADLTAWGEVAHMASGRYRKTWEYTDRAKNVDGLLFHLTGPDGRAIGRPTESEDEIDARIIEREAKE